MVAVAVGRPGGVYVEVIVGVLVLVGLTLYVGVIVYVEVNVL
jgi:hypothetical protein